MWQQDQVQLICCPPAPLERIVSISKSFISISKSSASTSGIHNTVEELEEAKVLSKEEDKEIREMAHVVHGENQIQILKFHKPLLH